LDLTKCFAIQTLPDGIGDLQNLAFLSLRSCRNLSAIPESIGRLSKLYRLDCKDCMSLKYIPTSLLIELPNLAEFEVAKSVDSQKVNKYYID
jgi:hypothetical protein